jgi:hypothetical protein
LVHGDFHPGNVFWKASAPVKVTFIDTGRMHRSMRPDGTPIGPPELDVATFEWELGHYGLELGLNPGEVATLRASRQVYHDFGGARLSDARTAVVVGHQVLDRRETVLHRATTSRDDEMLNWGMARLRLLTSPGSVTVRRISPLQPPPPRGRTRPPDERGSTRPAGRSETPDWPLARWLRKLIGG